MILSHADKEMVVPYNAAAKASPPRARKPKPDYFQPEEMEEIGYEDCFYGEGVCLVEWAELIKEILPENCKKILIEKDLEKGFDYRRITIEGDV